ncbi:MAG: hypothetical protein ACRDGQ_05895, partial [Candidatus Limnocylindrales bacterium]
PNGPAVLALLERLGTLDAAGVAALASVGRKGGAGDGRPDPWPPDTTPDDDEALRVSSLLAGADAAAAVPSAGAHADELDGAHWAAARLAHLLVLRHAFAPRTFASLTRPWRPRFLPDDRPAPRVHRPGRG